MTGKGVLLTALLLIGAVASAGFGWVVAGTGTGVGTAQAPYGPLGQPTNLAATPGPSIGEVTLEWTPAANADLHPAVWLPAGTATIRWRVLGNDSLAAATIDGLEPGHNYYFVVVAAQIGVAWSKASNLVTAIAAGYSHTCALNTDAAAVCWGSNEYGKTAVPDGAFTAITAGGEHSCGLRADGFALCWGDGHYGQLDAPEGRYTAISAGELHTCAIKEDGGIACWGSNASNQAPATVDGRFASINAGKRHTCAIKTDGYAMCWGSRVELHDIWARRDDRPDTSVASISASDTHNC